MSSVDIEEIYKRITSLPRVTGFIITNCEGLAIKSTLDPVETLKFAGIVCPLIEKSRQAIHGFVVEEEENTDDDVEFIRIHSRYNEILLSPEGEYTLVVIQLPHEDEEEENSEDKDQEGENKN